MPVGFVIENQNHRNHKFAWKELAENDVLGHWFLETILQDIPISFGE